MTPREAAGYALTKAYRAIQNGDGWGDASAHIEQAITAAVEEARADEHEECAKIAEKAIGYSHREIAEAIRNIRARSTASDRSAAPAVK